MDNTDFQTALPPQPETGTSLDALPTTSVQRRGPVWQTLCFLASLKITVILFVLCMFLIFASSLAQIDLSNHRVVELYFGKWSILVWIPLQIFFPRSFKVPGVLPFPGGMTLGTLLLINLLAAHTVRFKLSWKRLGMLIIHSGLIILLLGELETRLFLVEGKMIITEGSSSSVVFNPFAAELAIAAPSPDPQIDDVISVPGSLLQNQKVVHDAQLPFDVEVVRYMKNSNILQSEETSEPTPATKGIGLQLFAEEEPEVGGASSDERGDAPSAYLTLKTPQGGDLGTYLFSTLLNSQPVTVGGKTYQVSLRWKQSYRPFSLHLIKFSFDRYEGTSMAKNYSSLVRLVDPEENVDREVLIKMNEPLRYRGEAFYQADFDHESEKGTILQVMRNPGWRIPYISCAIVFVGLIVHFGLTLVNFLNRRVAA
jgi:hypothetical protein